ncbi:isochorismate synthase [uncultured Actinomyces sp.]|uniref:isochorismate synthase n=1 Tax=uncultured Actinomyces sp. TaxID=249061 RepID=UPI00260EC4B0|nr:isochorismate synthase [uncultured Actinomyces sp.]
MVGLGRALTLESAAPDVIAQVRRAWEAAPVSSSAPTAGAARTGEATPASSPAAEAHRPGEAAPASSLTAEAHRPGEAATGDAPSPVPYAGAARTGEATPASSLTAEAHRPGEAAAGDAPSPVLFASFAFRSPARSVAFVSALTLIDEAGARWAITAGIGQAPDPLAAVDAALTEARPAPRVPESLTFGQGSMSRTQWRDSVRSMAARLREGAADKAVMARDMTIRCSHGFDERFLLERLSDLYPSTWRFCVDSLVGASPEMLIAAACGTASSRVLAGTCKPGEGQALASSAKDLREHELASESVSSIVTELCSHVRAQGPFLLSLPNVVHLATDIHARLGAAHLLDLVAALHPTAAVCGTPRDAAMRLIEELEDTERGRYSGPVGWVDTAGDGEFAIALRCGLASGTRLRLFAGAGIMPDSDPNLELTETEAKMRPLLDALGV